MSAAGMKEMTILDVLVLHHSSPGSITRVQACLGPGGGRRRGLFSWLNHQGTGLLEPGPYQLGVFRAEWLWGVPDNYTVASYVLMSGIGWVGSLGDPAHLGHEATEGAA